MSIELEIAENTKKFFSLCHPFSDVSEDELEKILMELIKKGINVNAKDDEDDEETPLHRASLFGYTNVVKALVSANAKLDIINKYGQTALHLAAKYKETDIIRFLLEQEVDIDAQDNYGHTALYFASWTCRTENVRLLLDANTRTDIQTNTDGFSPLHVILCREGTEATEIAQLLLDADASIRIQDKLGNTPLITVERYCSENHFKRALKLILGMPNFFDYLPRAKWGKAWEAIKSPMEMTEKISICPKAYKIEKIKQIEEAYEIYLSDRIQNRIKQQCVLNKLMWNILKDELTSDVDPQDPLLIHTLRSGKTYVSFEAKRSSRSECMTTSSNQGSKRCRKR